MSYASSKMVVNRKTASTIFIYISKGESFAFLLDHLAFNFLASAYMNFRKKVIGEQST